VTTAEVVAAFALARNADDEAERLRLLTAACLPDAVFVSPEGAHGRLPFRYRCSDLTADGY
jgi:hypothetical protein